MQDISFDFDLASWSPGGFLRSMPYRGCPLCLVFRSKKSVEPVGELDRIQFGVSGVSPEQGRHR
jgi:hypothetical protein